MIIKSDREILIDAIIKLESDSLSTQDLIWVAKETDRELIERLINISIQNKNKLKPKS